MPRRHSNVSPARPHPRSTSRRPARAYVAVSRSGETCSPHTSVSSPVLPMTVSSRGSRWVARPRRSLAAPVPPARATTRMSVAEVFAQGPERAAAAPGVEARALPAREGWRQRALGHGDEAEAHPDPVQTLRAREDRDDAGGAGVVQDGGEELRGDLQRLFLDDDDGPVQEHRRAVALSDDGADQALTAVDGGGGAPRQGDFGCGPGNRGKIEERPGHRGVRQGSVPDTLPDPRNGRRSERRNRNGGGSGTPRAASSPTSCQAPRPSGSSRGGTCTRAWPES